MDTKLFVGNLAWETTGDDLKEYFGQFGTVVSSDVMVNKFSNRSRGFAFVVMASNEDAENAISKTEGVEFQGRALKVNIARPKTEEAPRRSFGGPRKSFGGPRSGGFNRGGRGPSRGGFSRGGDRGAPRGERSYRSFDGRDSSR